MSRRLPSATANASRCPSDEIDGVSAYRLSNSGTLVFRPAPSNAGRTLVWVDRKGLETPVNIAARAISTPSVSPDGRRLAFAVAEGGRRDIELPIALV